MDFHVGPLNISVREVNGFSCCSSEYLLLHSWWLPRAGVWEDDDRHEIRVCSSSRLQFQFHNCVLNKAISPVHSHWEAVKVIKRESTLTLTPNNHKLTSPALSGRDTCENVKNLLGFLSSYFYEEVFHVLDLWSDGVLGHLTPQQEYCLWRGLITTWRCAVQFSVQPKTTQCSASCVAHHLVFAVQRIMSS